VDASSWVLGAIVVTAVVGEVLYFRSLRRWQDTKPTSAEAKQAEARLWSTRNLPQR